jgi:hypothetical protein
MSHARGRFRTTALWAAGVLALLLGGNQDARAQLPNPSAASLGMAENFTALARGYASAAWNPAGLGMQDNPAASFTMFAARAMAGLHPVTFSDLKSHQGQTVPAAVREQWLEAITAAGGEQGSGGGDLTFLSASALNFGIQAGTSVRTVANLGPGAAELLLFGNAGRDEPAHDLTLAGSSLDVLATSTLALAYAQPLVREPGKSLSLGMTAKYVIGHFVFSGQDIGGMLKSDPLSIDVQFPMVVSATEGSLTRLNKGGGLAVDLGWAYQEGAWSAGFTMKNVVNRFQWDESALSFRPGQARFSSEASSADPEVQEFSAAPVPLQERVHNLVGGKQTSFGVAYQSEGNWLLTADLHRRKGDAHLAESKTHLGLGIELRPLRWLPIRTGGALLDDGYLAAAGAGLEWGLLNLTASVAHRQTSFGTGPMAMFTLSSSRSPSR